MNQAIYKGRSTDPPKVLVNIYFPGKRILKANVVETATVSDLKPIIPFKGATLIHNGIVLTDSISFKYYGIKEKDVIVVVNSNKDSNSINKWKSITSDKEVFNEKIAGIIDPQTARETARIRDFQLMRMERKPRIFRKLCASIPTMVESKPFSGASLTVFSYQRPGGPSSDPLPIIRSEKEPDTTEMLNPIPSPSLLSQEKQVVEGSVRTEFDE